MRVGDNMTLNELTNQYVKFKPDIEIDNLKDFFSLLTYYQKDLLKSIKLYKKELSENRKMYLEAKVRNFFFFIFQEEEASFYYYDDALIKEIIREMQFQYENISDIMLFANELNYQELSKLVDFMMMHYDNNIDFLENERKRLELSLENIIFHNDLDDTRDKMKTFMEQIISAYYEKIIDIEKIKKI